MTIWMFGVVLVLLIVAVVALSGAQPEGGRPVARTRLMGVARVVVLVVVLVLAYLAFRSSGG